MANGERTFGVTPLGYGAAILPGSTFDPTQFGQQVAAIEAGKKKKAAEDKKKQKDKLLADLNPDLGKLKWTAPYVEKYGKELEDYRNRNVKWYGDQGGELTVKQIGENNEFKERIKAEYTLLNEAYDRLQDAQDKVNNDPRFDTPENRALIEKLSDPYKNDAEGMKKAGGDIIQYVNDNFPVGIRAKTPPQDFTKAAEAIKAASQIEKGTQTGTDEFGLATYTKTTGTDLAKAKTHAEELWENEPYWQQKYPKQDDFTRKVLDVVTGDVTKVDRRKIDDTGAINLGFGIRTPKDYKVSYTEEDIATGFLENVLKPADTGQETVETDPITGEEVRTLRPEAFKEVQEFAEDYLTSDGWNILDENDKELDLNIHLDRAGVMTNQGIKFGKIGRQVDVRLSRIARLPTITKDINVNDLPESLNKRQLERFADKDGYIRKDIVVPKSIEDIIQQIKPEFLERRLYGIGETKAPAYREDDKAFSGVKIQKQLSKVNIIPYDRIRSNLLTRGIEIDENFRGKFTEQDGNIYEYDPTIKGKNKYKFLRKR